MILIAKEDNNDINNGMSIALAEGRRSAVFTPILLALDAVGLARLARPLSVGGR